MFGAHDTAWISKRRELQEEVSTNLLPANAITFMSHSAELYRRQVAQGLDGNPQAALKARVFLREWFGGKIRLEPLPDDGLQAHWKQNVGALCKGLGTYGSGGAATSFIAITPLLFRRLRRPSPSGMYSPAVPTDHERSHVFATGAASFLADQL